MIEYIPALVEAGIDAFKIEGRMREADYVEVVTRCYRESLGCLFHGIFFCGKGCRMVRPTPAVVQPRFFHRVLFSPPNRPRHSRVRGNVSPIYRQEIGHVVSYFPITQTAKIQITHEQLAVGDEITVDGFNTDTHFKQIVDAIQFGPNPIDHTPRVLLSDQKVVVEVFMSYPVMKNDRIYKYIPRSVNPLLLRILGRNWSRYQILAKC